MAPMGPFMEVMAVSIFGRGETLSMTPAVVSTTPESSGQSAKQPY